MVGIWVKREAVGIRKLHPPTRRGHLVTCCKGRRYNVLQRYSWGLCLLGAEAEYSCCSPIGSLRPSDSPIVTLPDLVRSPHNMRNHINVPVALREECSMDRRTGERECMMRTIVLRPEQSGKSSYSQSMNASCCATSDGWSKAFSR